ncbi:MAG: hypothetical protein H6735_06660 [Alphaproteobacteria bacterium]|nr:hypothetical protein [Alphaproteobacteria bacterium]
MAVPVLGSFEPGPHSWWATDPAWREGRGPYAHVAPADLERRLLALVAAHPDRASLVTLGRSRLDQPLLALRITAHPDRDEDEPAVLLTGATHGHELLTVLYALDAAERLLTEPSLARYPEALDVWIVPELNPDGVWTTLYGDARGEARSGRKNGAAFEAPPSEVRRGVDLNRNFPYGWGEEGSSADPDAWNHRGPEPASEPETRALMALSERYRFVASISLHTAAGAVLSPYTLARDNPEPDLAYAIATELAQLSPQRFTARHRLYPVAGADQDWLFHTYGTLALIVEGSHHNPRDEATVQRSVEGVRPIWEGLLRRVVDGPRVSGHVRDPDGQPLAARITVVGQVTREGEVWTSRPSDGRFDILLPDPGPHRVVAGLGDAWPALADVAGGDPVELTLRPR